MQRDQKGLLLGVVIVALVAASPALAQQQPLTQPPQQRAVDEIARIEVAHLKELLAQIEVKNEQRFKAQEQAVASALQAAEKATTKADTANEKRFDGVNEFRSQLKDQAGTFITRNEMWGWMVALVSLAFAAYNAFRKSRQPDFRERTET